MASLRVVGFVGYDIFLADGSLPHINVNQLRAPTYEVYTMYGRSCMSAPTLYLCLYTRLRALISDLGVHGFRSASHLNVDAGAGPPLVHLTVARQRG